MAKKESYTIRLGVEGGKVVTAEFGRVGAEGEKSLQRISAASRGATKSMADMSSFILTRLVPAFSAAKAAQSIFSNIQQFELIDARLKRLSKSTDDYARIQDLLRVKSDELNIGIGTLADSYSKLLALEHSNILNREEVDALAEGFANLKAALGVDDSQIGNVLYGLSQALGQGTVQAQELNQVIEPVPGFLNRIAEAAGKTPGAFRDMVKEGEISSQRFKELVLVALQDYAGAAADIEDTSVAALTRLNNSWVELSRTIGEAGVIDFIAGTAEELNSVLNALVGVTNGTIDFADAMGVSGKAAFAVTSAIKAGFLSAQLTILGVAEAMVKSLDYVSDKIRSTVNLLPGVKINSNDTTLDNLKLYLEAGRIATQEELGDTLDFSSASPASKSAQAQFEALKRERDKILSAVSNSSVSSTADTKPNKEEVKELERQKAAIDKVIESLKFKNEQMQRNQKDQAIYNELRAAGVAIDSQAGQEIVALVERHYMLEEMMDSSSSVTEKATKALEDYAKQAQDTDQQLADMAVGGVQSIEDSLVGLITGTKNASDAFSDMATSIISDLVRMQVQQNITKPLSNGLSGVLDGLFTPSYSSPYDMAAGGSIFSLPKYARGGVTDRPSIFGEAGPEAAVPLPDGRSIPVTLNGGAKVNVIINNNAASAQVSDISQRESSGGGMDVMVQLDEANSRLLSTPGSKTREGVKAMLNQGTVRR